MVKRLPFYLEASQISEPIKYRVVEMKYSTNLRFRKMLYSRPSRYLKDVVPSPETDTVFSPCRSSSSGISHVPALTVLWKDSPSKAQRSVVSAVVVTTGTTDIKSQTRVTVPLPLMLTDALVQRGQQALVESGDELRMAAGFNHRLVLSAFL